MKKLYWEVIAGLCGVGIVAVVVLPMFTRARETGGYNPDSRCGSNLKQVMLGLLMYSQDHDERFPPVASSGAKYGWANLVFDYTKSNAVLQCGRENARNAGNVRQSGFTDYWYNRNVAQRKRTEINNSISLFVLGDGNDGGDQSDARYSLNALPAKWIDDQNSPANRHRKYHYGGAFYAFADGHVKRLTPQEVLADPERYTFQVK